MPRVRRRVLPARGNIPTVRRVGSKTPSRAPRDKADWSRRRDTAWREGPLPPEDIPSQNRYGGLWAARVDVVLVCQRGLHVESYRKLVSWGVGPAGRD